MLLNLMNLWKGYVDMKWAERRMVYASQFAAVPQNYKTTDDFQATEVTLGETWRELRAFPALFSMCDIRTQNNTRVVGMNRDGMGDYTFRLSLSDGSFAWGNGSKTLVVEKGSV